MSDLQMSLLVIGAVVVAGVYGFNVFQERRYGRKMEKAFHAKPEDILISDDTTSEPRVRVEPVLSKPVEPEIVTEEETPFDYAPPEHAAPHMPAPCGPLQSKRRGLPAEPAGHALPPDSRTTEPGAS